MAVAGAESVDGSEVVVVHAASARAATQVKPTEAMSVRVANSTRSPFARSDAWRSGRVPQIRGRALVESHSCVGVVRVAKSVTCDEAIGKSMRNEVPAESPDVFGHDTV